MNDNKSSERQLVSIGSDEAGKGEWLGPMTIAAVAATIDQSSYLVTQGVMDSKELRTETVIKLSEIVKRNCLSYHVITIAPQRFNTLWQEVKREGKSLNDILAWGHAKTIDEVYKKLKAKGISGKIRVTIDEFDKLKTEKRLKRILELSDLIVEQKPRAEEETVVAAASILASTAREFWIDRECEYLGLDLRTIMPSKALSYENVEYFAKVGFLRHK